MALSKQERDALPADEFAVPGKRALPIMDRKHVAMAWSQVGRASGLTDAERSEARQRILAKAKSLGMDTSDWDRIKAMRLEAMALSVPEVQDHPNRMPFSGVLVHLDQPSDAAPHGSKGKLVMMSRAAAEAALPSLLGMAVDITPDFDGHDAQAKIGVITGATIEGSDLRIEGFVYAADFPEEAAFIKANKNNLGFSFEAQDIRVECLDSDPLVITACVFTGAAILEKVKAAFTTTSLAASAAAGDDIQMTKEELQAVLAAALKPVTDEMAELKAGQIALDAKIEAGKELHAKVAPHAEKLRACAGSLQAAGIGVHASRGHVAILNRMADAIEAEAMLGSMPHIYRDHDYNAGMYAGADPVAKTAVENAEVAALKAKIDDLTTKLESGIAASRDASPEPQRKTVPPQISRLLAKAGIEADGSSALDIAKVDRALSQSGLSIQERLRTKAALGQAGMLPAA